MKSLTFRDHRLHLSSKFLMLVFPVSPILHCHSVRLGWDPTTRTEHDGASRGQKIFQQKNTCGFSPESSLDPRIRKDDRNANDLIVDGILQKKEE